MLESRGRYELGHMNLPFNEAADRLDKRLKRDRRDHHNPEYGITIGPGISEEICGVLAALAEAEARGRRQGLEEAAAYHDEWAGINRQVCENETSARRHNKYAASIRSLATTPAETQKPETGESLNRLLASAEPTVSRQGNLLMLDCPDGTITDEIFNVLEAACYSSPNRSDLSALEGGEQP